MSASAVCGLDVGITTTDAVAGWDLDASVSIPSARERDPAAAAIERLLAASPPRTKDVVIAATGVGAHGLGESVCGARVVRVPEFEAIGRGGTRLAGRSEGLVVSLGTGTALVSVRGDEARHVAPGTGVGGGSLVGLSRALLGTDDWEEIARLASAGDRTRLDVTIGEVVGGPLGALPPSATASHFAKFDANSAREDVAAALVHMIVEITLTVTLLGLQAAGQNAAILIGRVLAFAPIRKELEQAAAMFGDLLVLPPRPALATALGALWSVDGRRDGARV